MRPLRSSGAETDFFVFFSDMGAPAHAFTQVWRNVFALTSMWHDNQVESVLSIVFLLLSFFVA